MSRARQQRSDDELRQASMVVDYEVSMLGSTLHILLASNVNELSSSQDQALNNALLHSFLIAARNLFHFLHSHNPRPNDMVAEDFFDVQADWRRERAPGPSEFQDGSFVRMISRRLAHLTWDRATQPKPLWTAFRIAWELVTPLALFVSRVPPERIDKRFRQDVEVLGAELRQIASAYS